VAEFVEACRAEDIVPFLYHTTIDWQWWKDLKWPPRDGGPQFAEYLDYFHASIELLCRNYGPIGGLWFDGNWAHPEADWKEDRLYALIRKFQPEAMIINNTGLDAQGGKGHPEVDIMTFEQGLPTMPDQRGSQKYLAREMCQTMNAHWGVGADDFAYLSPRQIIENLCLSRKVGANYLLNVGPTAQGGIPQYENAALRRVGDWTARYDTILREGRPVDGTSCSGRDFILQVGRSYYYFAFNLAIKGNDHVTVNNGLAGSRQLKGLPEKIESARWIDNDEILLMNPTVENEDLLIAFTPYSYGTQLVVRVAELRPV